MAYLNSSAPLPQNALDPPPAAAVAAANRRIFATFLHSRLGRERVYATLPTAVSLWAVAPGLAVHAAQIIPQSEANREALLTGMALPSGLAEPTLEELQAAAPTVVPLESSSGLDMTQQGLMPAPAPVPIIGGLWWSAQPPAGVQGQRGGYRAMKSGAGDVVWALERAQKSPAANAGPGCTFPPSLPVRTMAPIVTAPAPPMVPAAAVVPRPPSYNNLCWALRNGAVLQSQFSGGQYAQLQLACSQKGYAGNCPPPPDVLAWQQANAGNLPAITFGQADLDAIPPAPATIGSCPDSYQLGGMSGWAPNWGDALAEQAAAAESPGALWLSVLAATLAVAGASLLGSKKRKGR